MKTINGWMVNPTISGDSNPQAFDGRAHAFDLSLLPALPFLARGGDSLVKASSLMELDNACQGSANCLEAASVLTVVDQAPTTGSFRPPYVATTAAKPTYNRSDFDATLLPSLDSSLRPSGIPANDTFAAIAEDFRPVQLTYTRYRSTFPTGNLPSTWDLGYLQAVSHAALVMLMDASTQPVDFEDAFISFTQAAIDNYHAMAEGQGNWSKTYAVWFTALYTGQVSSPPSNWSRAHSYTERRIVPTSLTQVGLPLFGDEDELLGGMTTLSNGKVVDRDEYRYWRSTTADISYDYYPDPYGYIDGGPAPQKGRVGNLAKSAALLMQLGGAAFYDAWGPTADDVIHFAEIHVEEGVKAGYDADNDISTDPCAPAPYSGLLSDASEWFDFDDAYGVTFGPDGHGDCIKANPVVFNRFLNGQPSVHQDYGSSSLDRDLWHLFYTLQFL